MRIVVTAGPTREYIDAVRYISNASSGRMGYALAAAAARRAHEVTLISGPVCLAAPEHVRLVSVESTEQMRQAVLRAFGRCDALVMAAAVCDYKPSRRRAVKLPRKGGLTLELTATADILAEVGLRKKAKQVVVGFALEARSGRRNAARKLREKRLDAIVLNSPSAIGAARSRVSVLLAGGSWQDWGLVRKSTTAARLIRLIEQLASR